MAKEKFIDHKFTSESLELIETANNILNEYRGMGYRLSLRQLYYQSGCSRFHSKFSQVL